MEMHQELERVFRETFNDESLTISDEMTSQDVPGWDSLTHINLMFAIESTFGMQFVGNELADLKNIGELKALLAKRSASARAQSN
jgi:acyl carrier protein